MDPLKSIVWIVTGIVVVSVLYVVISACMLSSKLSREEEEWEAWQIHQEELRRIAAAQLGGPSRETTTETTPASDSPRATGSRRNRAK